MDGDAGFESRRGTEGNGVLGGNGDPGVGAARPFNSGIVVTGWSHTGVSRLKHLKDGDLR